MSIAEVIDSDNLEALIECIEAGLNGHLVPAGYWASHASTAFCQLGLFFFRRQKEHSVKVAFMKRKYSLVSGGYNDDLNCISYRILCCPGLSGQSTQ